MTRVLTFSCRLFEQQRPLQPFNLEKRPPTFRPSEADPGRKESAIVHRRPFRTFPAHVNRGAKRRGESASLANRHVCVCVCVQG